MDQQEVITPSTQNHKTNFLIPTIILVGILLTISLFYFGYQFSLSKQTEVPTPTPLPQNKTFPIQTLAPQNNTTNWKIFTNKQIGFEFKYPPSFEDFGTLTEKYQESESGFNYCLKPIKETSFKFINLVYAGGGGCFTDNFGVSANSFDYERGSEGSFLDFSGYEKVNNDIKIIRPSQGMLSDPIPQNFYKISTNQNGVEIIKIYGQPSDPNNPLRTDNPGEGFIAALVNTKSKNYPGIAFIANLKTTATEEVFDQILSSIKIFPAEEIVLPYINYDYKFKNYVAQNLFAISFPKEGYYPTETQEKLSYRLIISNMSDDQKRRDIMNAEYFDVDIIIVYNMSKAYYEEFLRDQYPGDGILGNYKREKITIDGMEFDKFASTYHSIYPYEFKEDYYLLKGIKSYEISIYGRSKTEDFRPKADQILSTFKFL